MRQLTIDPDMISDEELGDYILDEIDVVVYDDNSIELRQEEGTGYDGESIIVLSPSQMDTLINFYKQEDEDEEDNSEVEAAKEEEQRSSTVVHYSKETDKETTRN